MTVRAQLLKYLEVSQLIPFRERYWRDKWKMSWATANNQRYQDIACKALRTHHLERGKWRSRRISFAGRVAAKGSSEAKLSLHFKVLVRGVRPT